MHRAINNKSTIFALQLPALFVSPDGSVLELAALMVMLDEHSRQVCAFSSPALFKVLGTHVLHTL
jgi:hypothetical protein